LHVLGSFSAQLCTLSAKWKKTIAETNEVLLIDLASAREWQRGRDVYNSIHFADSGSKSTAERVVEALKDRMGQPLRRWKKYSLKLTVGTQ